MTLKLPKHLTEERTDIIIWLYNKGYSDGDIQRILTHPITRQRVYQVRVEGRLQHSEPIKRK